MPPKPKSPRAEPRRVAVCIDTRDGPGRERLLGVYRYAQLQGWRLFLVRGSDAAACQQLPGMQLDGAILYDRPRGFHQALKDLGVICVETGARNLDLDDGAVFMDDAALVRVAVDHLLRVGYEHFGYCGLEHIHPSVLRAENFRLRLQERGFATGYFEETWPDGEVGLENLIRWLRGLPKPAGVLAFDDKLAERILAACRWASLRVPEEIGVLGIGDDELICELAYPALSSVALPTKEIGRQAAELLGRLLAKKATPQRHWPMQPLEVVVRTSTERIPSTHPAVLAAVQFIRDQGHRSIGTDQIAAAIRLPRRTLERRFVADLHCTVHDFVVKVRLERAKRLLRQSDAALSEIAQTIGYNALSAFTRMFTDQTGCHPEEYRRMQRASRGGN